MPWPTHFIQSDRPLRAEQVEHIRTALDEVKRTGATLVMQQGLRLETFPQNPHAIADGMLAAFSREG